VAAALAAGFGHLIANFAAASDRAVTLKSNMADALAGERADAFEKFFTENELAGEATAKDFLATAAVNSKRPAMSLLPIEIRNEEDDKRIYLWREDEEYRCEFIKVRQFTNS
jgi:hypothetical protein